MLTAETTLNVTRASLVDLDRQRAQAEHAIAVLTGVPPADLTIRPIASWSPGPPVTPLLVPSTLLQRLPDVVAAERNAAAANAQIGARCRPITLTSRFRDRLDSPARMTEAVDLIEALGGGWSADELESR